MTVKENHNMSQAGWLHVINSKTNLITNEKGVTLIELLITISIGSIVIIMLMQIMSTTLLTRNIVDHENRLLQESYNISEYLQETIFDLGVRSIEDASDLDRYAFDEEHHTVLILRHEYDIQKSAESGVIYRDYSERRAFVLYHDKVKESLYYGPLDDFSFPDDSEAEPSFSNPSNYKINSDNVAVESFSSNDITPQSSISYTCLLGAEFLAEEEESTIIPEDEDTEDLDKVERCASAIIEINLQLSYRIEDNPVFNPQQFRSTIVF